jgi:carboxylate-amine ligase
MTTGSASNFTDLGAVGVEEEFFVVDADGFPTSGSDELVYENEPPPPIRGRIDHELFKFVLETQTPKLDGPSDAADAVHDVRDALVDYAAEHGFQIAAAGLHPNAHWRELEHAQKPRYRAQLDRIQYPQHRNTTAGLHVHVGVDDADKATWIANEIRWYLPIMLALSANSPFWNGFDTGLASARSVVFENLPNTGMPTAFESFEAYESFERLMVENGSINDRGELWWDVRPHTEHGTVEVRTPDAQHDPRVVLAFVEYTHALVMDLAARYEDGESPVEHRRELLDENKWRALRYGHDASFIDVDRDGAIDLADVVDRECDRLGVSGIRGVLDAGEGATRQRNVLEAQGPAALREELLL